MTRLFKTNSIYRNKFTRPLNALLSSNTATEMFEDEWIKKTKDIDEVYVGLVFDYISSLGLQPEDFIKITK